MDKETKSVGSKIVYCNACGTRLRDQDFGAGRANVVDDQSYCTRCLPPDVAVQTSFTSKRMGHSIPARPFAPNAPNAPNAPPAGPTQHSHLLFWAAGAAGLGLLLALLVLPTGGGSSEHRESPPSPPASSQQPSGSPSTSDLAEKIRELSRSLEDGANPDAIASRCQELEIRARGAPEETALADLRKRAEAKNFKVDTDRQMDMALIQVRALQDADPTFERAGEVGRLLAKARQVAGTRRIEVDRVAAAYQKGFDDAARAAVRAADEEARNLAGSSKFREAAERLEQVPLSFRATDSWVALLREKARYLAQQAELDERRRELIEAPWKDWTISTDPSKDTPRKAESFEGRPSVLFTHPTDPDHPASVERMVDLPAGSRKALVFWVSPSVGNGRWELRVVIDSVRVMADTIGGEGMKWKEIRVDLAPNAGRKVLLRLENATTGWDPSWGVWSGLEVRDKADLSEWASHRGHQKELWSPWKIESSSFAGMPVILDAYFGRRDVLRTHPFTQEKPCTLTRELFIPRKKRVTFSVWVSHIPGADWEARIVVQDNVLAKRPVAGDPIWKKIDVDLTPHAGKTILIRLENAANDWNNEYGFWGDPEVTATAD